MTHLMAGEADGRRREREASRRGFNEGYRKAMEDIAEKLNELVETTRLENMFAQSNDFNEIEDIEEDDGWED